jgi:hypothetical protein
VWGRKLAMKLYDKLWCIKPKKFITGDFSSLMPLLVLDQKNKLKIVQFQGFILGIVLHMRGQDEMRSDGYCCRLSVKGKGIKSCSPWKSSHLRGMLSMVLCEKEGIHSQQLMKYLSTV